MLLENVMRSWIYCAHVVLASFSAPGLFFFFCNYKHFYLRNDHFMKKILKYSMKFLFRLSTSDFFFIMRFFFSILTEQC